MIIEQIWTANPFRNFNYLIACPDTGDALAVDPRFAGEFGGGHLDAEMGLAFGPRAGMARVLVRFVDHVQT